MARPIGADSSETINRILGCALHRVDASGPGGVSLRSVAADAGLSVGAVRYYFPTKAALLEGMLEQYHREQEKLFAGLVRTVSEAGVGDDDALVDSLARTAFRFVRRRRSLASLRIHEPGDGRSARLGALTERLVAPLAARSERSTSQVRMDVQLVDLVINRLATLPPEGVELFTGRAEADVGDIEDYVVSLCRRLFRESEA